jgi:hypothetical protein
MRYSGFDNDWYDGLDDPYGMDISVAAHEYEEMQFAFAETAMSVEQRGLLSSLTLDDID